MSEILRALADDSLSIVEVAADPTTRELLVQATLAIFPAAQNPADGEANDQTTTSIRSRTFGFNGTTWDRARAGILGKILSADGVAGHLNSLPVGRYNAIGSRLSLANGDHASKQVDVSGFDIATEPYYTGSGAITTQDTSGDLNNPTAGSFLSVDCPGSGSSLVSYAPTAAAHAGVTLVAELWDGTRWSICSTQAEPATDISSARALTANSTGLFRVHTAGGLKLRIRNTTAMTDSVTVAVACTQAPMGLMPDAMLKAGERLTENYQAVRPAAYTGSTDALTWGGAYQVNLYAAKASPGNLHMLMGSCTTARYIQVHDSLAPAGGATPKFSMYVAANSNFSFNFGLFGLNCTTGIYVGASSVRATYTVSATSDTDIITAVY